MSKIKPEVKELLDFINAWAIKHRDSANIVFDAWWILTALRGPDNGNQELKGETTIPIRAAAIPELMTSMLTHSWGGPYLAQAYRNPEFKAPAENDHFTDHAVRAAMALGLKS